jgi:hypothetical protein
MDGRPIGPGNTLGCSGQHRRDLHLADVVMDNPIDGLAVLVAVPDGHGIANVSRVAVLWDPARSWHPTMLKEVEAAAPSLLLLA